MESGHNTSLYLKTTGEQSLTLFALTIAAGSTCYFGGKTFVYLGSGLKNLGSQFLNTSFGSTLAKIVSWPFKQLWFGICWVGRSIKSLTFWGFSCIRHPIESLKSTLNHIRNIVSFIFSWTILLVYQKVSSFINNYIPSIRPPLIAGAITGTLAFAASFISHHEQSSNEPILKIILIKSIVVLAGVLIAAPYLSQRFTSVSLSRLESGVWGTINGTLFFGLAATNILKNPIE